MEFLVDSRHYVIGWCGLGNGKITKLKKYDTQIFVHRKYNLYRVGLVWLYVQGTDKHK